MEHLKPNQSQTVDSVFLHQQIVFDGMIYTTSVLYQVLTPS